MATTSIIILALAGTIVWTRIRPSNERMWSLDQAILPYAEIENGVANIGNIRDFIYTSTTNYTPHYYDASFDIANIKKVYYVLEPFGSYRGPAHAFLSFEFEDGVFIAISIEIRKRRGDSFSPFWGLLKRYELMYVIGSERDLIGLRSNHRKDRVYVYPVKTSIENVRALFLDMLHRANKLKEKPEFYNTLSNNCTTNIVRHISKIISQKISFRIEVLLPENSDRLAYNLGLIDTALSFKEARERFLINERAIRYADDPDFSVKIRSRS